MNGLKEDRSLLDLDKVKEVIFKDIDLLMDSLNLNYTISNGSIFMCCPIHEGSDNPQGVSISLDKKCWKCWTRSCEMDYGHSIFGFIQGAMSKQREATFGDVLSFICKTYNISSDESLTKKPLVNYENDLRDIVKIFKKHDCNENPTVDFEDIKTIGVSPYFEQRGYKKDTLKYFKVEDCEDKESVMYKRSIIPIHSADGLLAAFIARSTKKYIIPKYIYTKGFNKSYYLYNYHRAIDHALLKNCLFVTEGQGDVWRLYEAGVKNAIGLFGKDISTHQKLKLLKSGITTLVVLTDNDQSGRESKTKIYREFNRMFTLKFPIMNKKDIGDMTVENVCNHILPQVEGLY